MFLRLIPPSFLLFLCFITVSSSTNAQTWGGGIHLGANFAQVDGDNYGGYNKPGYSFGAYVWYDFSYRFAIQPEIILNQRGARQVDENTYWHLRMNYLDVPVMLNLRLFGDHKVGVVLQAGPSWGIQLWTINGPPGLKKDVTSSFSRFEMGANTGLELQFFHYLKINLRHSLSLTNNNTTTYPRLVHRYFTLSVRVTLKSQVPEKRKKME